MKWKTPDRARSRASEVHGYWNDGNPTKIDAIAQPARVILIAYEPFGCGFDVTILPPPEGVGHDCEFADHRAALGYALRLREATGWMLRDQTGEDAT